jgi:ribosomal protein L7Ae-like RNA K-turn-binding protein
MEAAKDGIRDAASATKGVADATRDVSQSVSRSFENVVSSISSSSELIRRVVEGIAHANQQLVTIAQDADSPQIHSFVVEFEETANVMAQSVDVLSRAVEHVSKQLKSWNEGPDVNS